MYALAVLLFGLQALLCQAQFPKPPTGLTFLESILDPSVKITYKQTHICETTPGVKSFSGYVHLPAATLHDVPADYNISMFFWYFEARHNPKNAPLALYLAGGPGVPSIQSVLNSESGPCYVNLDGNTTTINPWSFNNHVNMLYIDQPVQTGFSYDSLINGSYNVVTSEATPSDFSDGFPEQNDTFLIGTFPSQNKLHVTNTSIASAKALWHFAEHWLTSFPGYDTQNNGISVWGNSYGGYWTPAVGAYFDQMIKSSKIPCLHKLKMATVGMTNGCVDFLVQAPYYPILANNNTYGIQLFPTEYDQGLLNNFTKPGGCRDLIEQCRALGVEGDPNWTGANETVNEACTLTTNYCYAYVISNMAEVANRSDFDIAIQGPDPCPFYTPVSAYLNQEWVQQALGVPLNYTIGYRVVLDVYSLAFTGNIGTGDAFRRGKGDFEYALNNDIQVSMVFGDRDYRCNWLAAEALTLDANYPQSKQFRAAGYEKIVTNGTYDGGVVRQHGGFSFARIFDAGHSVSLYQPETVFRVFMRAMFGRDVATGKVSTTANTNYSSTGLASSFGIKNVLPPSPETCIVEGQAQAQLQPSTLD